MTGLSSEPVDLLELYKRPVANQLSGFCEYAGQLDADDLVAGYRRLVDAAPRRHSLGKKYFVGHSGEPCTGARSNRREEHLAMALWNWSDENGPLPIAGAGELTLLDYQFPLKARQGDAGVGKVDLFGLINGQRPCVVELKIHPHGKGKSDTPLRAFLEALAYCAIVEANVTDIAVEAAESPGIDIQPVRPVLMVLAPGEHWEGYLDHPAAGDWRPALYHLAQQLRDAMSLQSYFVALDDARFEMGLNGQKPRMTGSPFLVHLATFIEAKR
jgi:hypothetical protein